MSRYLRLHSWLRKNYGKANKCGNINCSKISKKFDWALIKGKKYKFDKSNYFMLCRSCHILYDFTNSRREKYRKRMMRNNYGFKKNMIPWNKNKVLKEMRGVNHPMFGKTHTLEARIKISNAHKGKPSWNKGLKCDWLIGNKHGFKKGHIPWNKGINYKQHGIAIPENRE